MTTFNRSTSKHPSMLTHSGIEIFTHELGHAIHRLIQGSGQMLSPRDFVEVPSIMAENWIHEPSVLQQLSCHYTYLKPEYLVGWKEKHAGKVLPPQPPRKAPLDMFDEIKFRRHPKHDLWAFLYLIWQSKFDFTIHSASAKELESMDLGVVCRQILEDSTGIFTPPDGEKKKMGENGELQNNAYLHWSILKDYDTSAYCYLL